MQNPLHVINTPTRRPGRAAGPRARPGRARHPVPRYGAAVLLVGAAAVVTRLLSGLGDSGISPQFFAAVLLSAWFGGLGPGLLATLMSGLATGYLLMVPHANSFVAIREDVLRVLVFTAVAVVTSSLHAATQRAREAAESASAAKSRFLAMVSHELRTPLSPVVAATEMLLDDPDLPERVRRDVATIRRNIELEVRLINDLLDLTRIGSGKLALRAERLDAHDPLAAAARVCEAEARDKRQQLRLRPAAVASHVVGDPVRLEQIFWNLIRNAIKFTPEGGSVTIATRNDADTSPRAAPPADLVIEVSDTGIGIDPARLAAIFDAFEQADPDIAARFGGLGLGLAICQALAEAHGGSVTAASPGRGSGATFTVRLPLARLPEPAKIPTPEDGA